MADNVTTPLTQSKYLKERPTTITAAPADLRMSRAQRWTVWTLRPNPNPQKKPSKVPISNPTDPSTWTFYHAARATLSDPKVAGIGFEMHGRSEIIGVDIDNCLDEVGQRTPVAAQFLSILEATRCKCHVEISPSGKGLRIFAAETPTPFHDFTNKDTGVEVYTGEAGRFLAFTGSMVPGFTDGPFDPLPVAAIEFLGKHALKWKEGQGEEHASPVTEPQPDLPELSQRADWEKLHPNAIRRLGAEHKKFMEAGTLGKRYASASEQLFAVEQALLKHLKPAQAYQLLISADGSWQVALEHRENSVTKAKAFIWDDLQRAAKSKEKHEKEKAAESSGWKDCDILVEITEDGAKARMLMLNAINAFQKHSAWLNRLGWNTFDGRVMLDKKEVGLRELAEMSAWLVEFLRWPYEMRRQDFEDALMAAARTRPWNPIEDELRSLVWDGKPRIKKLAEAMSAGTAAGGLDLDTMMLRKWLIGFVARGINPGCQMDTVLCLREREGGGFKTRFCRAMAGPPERYTDSPGFGGDKESSMLRGGMRIIELGEGVAVKRSDRHQLKLDVTKTADHFRPPWGRVVELRKRGFLYILTVNDHAFMRSDQDGLRRIWPIDARDIMDIEWITENREQLLAEAVARFDAGEMWWWDKGHEPIELKQRQGTAVAEDFMDGALEAVIADKDNIDRGYSTLLEIKKQVEGIAGMVFNTTQAQHLVDMMSRHGFKDVRRSIDKRQRRVWTHDDWAGGGEAQVLEFKRGER